MARLIGQFLILSEMKCTNCGNYHLGDAQIQFAPRMNPGDEFPEGQEYTTPNGRARKIVGKMSDDNGFLSWLMSQTVPVDAQDDETDEFVDEPEPISAMQGLQAAMQEAYRCGVEESDRRWDEEAEKIQSDFNNTLNGKQKQLEKTLGDLQAANEREANAQKTIKALQEQLEALKPAEVKPTTEPTLETTVEPQPEPENTEPVTAATSGGNGESDGSNGTNGQ